MIGMSLRHFKQEFRVTKGGGLHVPELFTLAVSWPLFMPDLSLFLNANLACECNYFQKYPHPPTPQCSSLRLKNRNAMSGC